MAKIEAKRRPGRQKSWPDKTVPVTIYIPESKIDDFREKCARIVKSYKKELNAN